MWKCFSGIPFLGSSLGWWFEMSPPASPEWRTCSFGDSFLPLPHFCWESSRSCAVRSWVTAAASGITHGNFLLKVKVVYILPHPLLVRFMPEISCQLSNLERKEGDHVKEQGPDFNSVLKKDTLNIWTLPFILPSHINTHSPCTLDPVIISVHGCRKMKWLEDMEQMDFRRRPCLSDSPGSDSAGPNCGILLCHQSQLSPLRRHPLKD